MRVARGARAFKLAVILVVALSLAGCSGEDAAPPATTAPPATVEPTTTTEVPTEGQERLYVYVPKVGDCFDQREEQDDKTKKRTMFTIVFDCSLPHESEVFALLTYTDPGGANLGSVPFPGDEAFREMGKRECPKQFRTYVGLDYELSSWTIGFRVPKAEDWPRDALIACTITPAGGTRTAGTARDSKR